jgi:hypothetical protein
MRLSNWLRLFALCLIAGSLPASASPLSARHPVAEAKKPSLQKEWIGYGSNVKLAEQDALQECCKWLNSEGGLGWSANPDYLRDHKMVRFSELEDKQFEEQPDLGTVKRVKMTLQISEVQARDLQKQSQQQRMKERHKLSLLVLIGATCLLGVVGGYLRLEEATKGYCTRRLRIAAIGILIAIVIGLCVVG